MAWLGLDVGGAKLKLATGGGYADSRPFALWRDPAGLAAALADQLAVAPAAEGIAVTMTGELCDCFETKGDGVRAILDSVDQVVDDRPCRVYLTNGDFVSPSEARDRPLEAAASNWHALARLAGRYAPQGEALLIDVGSTTSDLIPLCDGQPVARGLTDPQRLVHGELVYTGVERSPLCAVASSLPWRETQCPTAHELFATTVDAYLTLGHLPEADDDLTTADGRPATRAAARDRLARSICADRTMFDETDAQNAATAVMRSQLARLGIAANRVIQARPAKPATVVVSGQGEFLAQELVTKLRLDAKTVSLSDQLGPNVSRVATAYAVAVLAAECD